MLSVNNILLSHKEKSWSASSGNRTRAARVAGEHSTTEPTMLCCDLLICLADPHAPAAVVAEWLRRLTRNQFPSGSVGSNPTNCDHGWIFVFVSSSHAVSSSLDDHQFLDSLVVRISACHVEGPGSIPGRGENYFWESKQKVMLQVRLELTTPA